MSKNHESRSSAEMPKAQEAAFVTPPGVERSPEDLKALDVRRRFNKLIDKYEIQRSKYELELLSQAKAEPATKKQIELNQELQELWDDIHSMIPELAEQEFMATNEGVQKSLKAAQKEIENLPEFTGLESAPLKKDKVGIEKGNEVVIKSRESIKKNAKEKIRSKDQIKKLRVKLAKLKSAFAGAYKMSPARAQILLSQPTGFLGALKGLSEGKMPSREERKKLGAIRSEDAQELLNNIQELDEKIDKEWKKAKKEAAITDIDNADAVEEIELDESISLPTLRASFTEEIKAARDANDDERAQELKQEINKIYDTLQEHFPELVRYPEVDTSHPERATLLPPEVNTPITVRDFKHEPKVITPEIKTQMEEESAQKEAPTLRSERETTERTRKTELAIQAFGGGEVGRKYAADLWDYANKQIQENGNIKLQGEKGSFKDALDYVTAFAENVNTSAEVLGKERSAQVWQEINDHRNELLKSPSLKPAERKQLESLDPIYYVTQSALRDKALQENDLNAASKHNSNIDELNALLGYPAGTNPSTGEGMGTSPQKETRGLGKNHARSEMSRMGEKTSGISAKSYEANTGKAQERSKEEPLTIEWAARMLPNAKEIWDNIALRIKEKGNKEATKLIKNSITDLESKLSAIKSGKNNKLADELRNIKQIESIKAGRPPEATQYTMLKALAGPGFYAVSKADSKAKKAINETLEEIDDLLLVELTDKDIIGEAKTPTLKDLPKEEKDLPRFKLPNEDNKDSAPSIETSESDLSIEDIAAINKDAQMEKEKESIEELAKEARAVENKNLSGKDIRFLGSLTRLATAAFDLKSLPKGFMDVYRKRMKEFVTAVKQEDETATNRAKLAIEKALLMSAKKNKAITDQEAVNKITKALEIYKNRPETPPTLKEITNSLKAT